MGNRVYVLMMAHCDVRARNGPIRAGCKPHWFSSHSVHKGREGIMVGEAGPWLSRNLRRLVKQSWQYTLSHRDPLVPCSLPCQGSQNPKTVLLAGDPCSNTWLILYRHWHPNHINDLFHFNSNGRVKRTPHSRASLFNGLWTLIVIVRGWSQCSTIQLYPGLLNQTLWFIELVMSTLNVFNSCSLSCSWGWSHKRINSYLETWACCFIRAT